MYYNFWNEISNICFKENHSWLWSFIKWFGTFIVITYIQVFSISKITTISKCCIASCTYSWIYETIFFTLYTFSICPFLDFSKLFELLRFTYCRANWWNIPPPNHAVDVVGRWGGCWYRDQGPYHTSTVSFWIWGFPQLSNANWKPPIQRWLQPFPFVQWRIYTAMIIVDKLDRMS